MSNVCCPNCLRTVSPQAKFCPNCGFPLEDNIQMSEDSDEQIEIYRNPPPLGGQLAPPPIPQPDIKAAPESDEKICPVCGTKALPDQKVCGCCGNPLDDWTEDIEDPDQKRRRYREPPRLAGVLIPHCQMPKPMEPTVTEDTPVSLRGRSICRKLKKMRRKFADANGIAFEEKDCTYKGPCSGTCPYCDSKTEELNRRAAELGIAVTYPDFSEYMGPGRRRRKKNG